MEGKGSELQLTFMMIQRGDLLTMIVTPGILPMAIGQ